MLLLGCVTHPCPIVDYFPVAACPAVCYSLHLGKISSVFLAGALLAKLLSVALEAEG